MIVALPSLSSCKIWRDAQNDALVLFQGHRRAPKLPREEEFGAGESGGRSIRNRDELRGVRAVALRVAGQAWRHCPHELLCLQLVIDVPKGEGMASALRGVLRLEAAQMERLGLKTGQVVNLVPSVVEDRTVDGGKDGPLVYAHRQGHDAGGGYLVPPSLRVQPDGHCPVVLGQLRLQRRPAVDKGPCAVSVEGDPLAVLDDERRPSSTEIQLHPVLLGVDAERGGAEHQGAVHVRERLNGQSGLRDEDEAVSLVGALRVGDPQELPHGGDEISTVECGDAGNYRQADLVTDGQLLIAGVLLLAVHEIAVARRLDAAEERVPEVGSLDPCDGEEEKEDARTRGQGWDRVIGARSLRWRLRWLDRLIAARGLRRRRRRWRGPRPRRVGRLRRRDRPDRLPLRHIC